MTNFRRLVGLVFVFWQWVILSVFLGWATIISWVALIGTSSYLISFAALQPSIAELQVAIVGVRFFGIARGVFRYLERLVSHKTTFKVLAELRVRFYIELEKITPGGIKNYYSGDLLARVIDDIETLQEFFIRVIYPPFVALLSCVSVLWFFGRWSFSFAVVIFIFQVFVGIVVPLVSLKLSKKSGEGLVDNGSKINQIAVDSIKGNAEVFAYNLFKDMRSQIENLGKRRISLQRKIHFFTGINNGLTALGVNFSIVILFVLAIPMVNEGRLDGKLLAVVILGTLVSFEGVMMMPAAMQNIGASLRAGQRLFEVFVQNEEVSVSTVTQQLSLHKINTLSMKNISFTYPGSNELVLENISFEIYPGKKIGVVGTSGVGKSTILNLLLRHWELSGGEYTINRKNIRNYLSDDIRKNIAVITQKVFLFNTTVADNIKIGNPDATDDQIVEVAKISGCHAFIEDLPFGYNTIVGEQGAFISGGEMQRIGLARALLKDASLYLFDEPFAHLDVISQNSIWQSLLPYLEKRGMLFVTHQKFGLSKMDEIIVIGGGKVVERGNYSQLIEAGGVFSQMWQLQEDMLFES